MLKKEGERRWKFEEGGYFFVKIKINCIYLIMIIFLFERVERKFINKDVYGLRFSICLEVNG